MGRIAQARGELCGFDSESEPRQSGLQVLLQISHHLPDVEGLEVRVSTDELEAVADFQLMDTLLDVSRLHTWKC